MSISVQLDEFLDRIAAGGELTDDELTALGATPDILAVGMLADTLRRRRHGSHVTYLRVADWPCDAPLDVVPPTAREIRITGVPETLAVALGAVEAARARAEGRSLSGFSWADVGRFRASGETTTDVLAQLRSAGLDAIAHVPLDSIEDPPAALGDLAAAGYERVRLSIDKAAADARIALMREAARLQDRFGCIQSVSPLPSTLGAFRPTTGYDDVKTVALARLAAPNIPTVQVDWLRYGPKLAQVALTFGADDIDNVTASDDAPDGRRRAPLEEVRRNITAAGFEPAERDGRFALV